MDTKTIRNTLKEKFGNWLDERCDKGVDTYGHELDDCPDDKFDWRDMLIEELLDGLQYQEKEIKRLKNEIEGKTKLLQVFAKHPKPQLSPFEEAEANFWKAIKPPYADLDD